MNASDDVDRAESDPAAATARRDEQTGSNAPANDGGARALKRGNLIVLALIFASLTWYLLADRFTPFTDQARVQGYVVGIAPKVGGMVTAVLVNNNQTVEAGQSLFEIDADVYRIALERAESERENASLQVGAGSAAVAAARAGLKAAEANELKARQDAERLTRLHAEDPGTVSVRRIEVATATLKQARAQVEQARADINRAIDQMGGSDADRNSILAAADTAVAKARLDLENTVVTAPSRGVITDLRAEVGQFAGPGTPVMTLIGIRDVWISAEFTENNLEHITAGTPVEILFDALPGRVYTGSVRSIGLGVSAGQLPPPGGLPAIQNSRDWLRPPQRFPVIIGFNPAQDSELVQQLRIGGQTTVIAYTEGHGFLHLLGRFWLRFQSWLSYFG